MAVSILQYGCTSCAFTKLIEKNQLGTTPKCNVLFWTNPVSNFQQNSSCISPPQKKIRGNKQDIRDTVEKARTNSLASSFIDSYIWMGHHWALTKCSLEEMRGGKDYRDEYTQKHKHVHAHAYTQRCMLICNYISM